MSGEPIRPWSVDPRAIVVQPESADVRHTSIVARRDAEVVLGEGVTLERVTIDTGPGCRVHIADGCRIRRCRIVARDGAEVTLGPGTTWESGAILATRGESVTLGEDCMVSNDVVVRTADGHGLFEASGRCVNEAEAVAVGDHVWLGHGVRVGKGCSIGEGTVVGQLSLAIGTLEPYTVYVGVPARPVRKGITWSRTWRWEDVPVRFRPTGADEA